MTIDPAGKGDLESRKTLLTNQASEWQKWRKVRVIWRATMQTSWSIRGPFCDQLRGIQFPSVHALQLIGRAVTKLGRESCIWPSVSLERKKTGGRLVW